MINNLIAVYLHNYHPSSNLNRNAYTIHMSLSFYVLRDDPFKFIAFIFVIRSLVIMNETHKILQSVGIPEQNSSLFVCVIVQFIGFILCCCV